MQHGYETLSLVKGITKAEGLSEQDAEEVFEPGRKEKAA
jgi:hypothetical protein